MSEQLKSFDLYSNWINEKQENQWNNESGLTQQEKLIIQLFLKQSLKETKDNSQSESLVKGFQWRENELIDYLKIYQQNLPEWSDILDDYMQINELILATQYQLQDLKAHIENQKEIPFEILWGQILVQNIEWKGWLKFSKWEKQWKQIWNDEISYNENTNRYEINIDYNWFPKHLEIEYNGWNVIKIHDTRYNRVERIQIISKDINVQDITSHGPNRARIESYQTAREIEIPFRNQRIKLQILFNH